MSEGSRGRNQASLDALLSANRESFDQLFRHQMAGGSAAGRTKPAEAGGQPAAPAPAAGPDKAENVVAILNRRFATAWSSEVIEREIRDGRATARCRLTVGDTSISDTGSSRVGDDSEDAAMQRAIDRALIKCADQLEQGTRAASAPSAARAASVQPLDVVTVNRVRAALTAARAEMDAVFARSARSAVRPDPHVQAAMIMDGAGNMVSGQFGSFLSHMLATRKLHLDRGDVLLVSDPYATAGAAGHLNDWLAISPVYHGADQVGFAAMHAHMTDVGGTAAGSMPVDTTSIFGEGVRIPPVKISEAGVLSAAALDVILANSRNPETNRTDLMAMIAALRAGEASVSRLCNRVGGDIYHRACATLLDQSRAAMSRAIVEAIPEEPQSFSDQIDDDGCGNGPFNLRLTVWREDDHAYFDWTGTSPQAQGPINFYAHVGLAKMFVGRYLLRDAGRDLVTDDGFYDLIHVVLPEGSVLHPGKGAALGRREHTLACHLGALGAAIDRHRPERLSAAGRAAAAEFVYSGEGFRMIDDVVGGHRARPGRDGADGHREVQGASTAEHLESAYPVLIESCRSIPDSGGAGRHRGGNAVEKVYHLLQAGHVSISDDRHLSRPWGVNGGSAGTVSRKWIERADGTREALPAKLQDLPVAPGDRIFFRTASGGGCCGDPFQRETGAGPRRCAGGARLGRYRRRQLWRRDRRRAPGNRPAGDGRAPRGA